MRRTVQEQPIESKLADGLTELAELDRFLDVAIRAELIPSNPVPLLIRGGQDHDRNELEALVLTDSAEDLEAVDACETPARSRVEIRYVYNAAVDALVKWVRSRYVARETERRVTEYERDGNPAWLKIISECSHRRIVLLRAAIGPEDDPVSLQAFFDAVGKASVSAWEGVTAPVWEDDDSEEGEDFDLWQD